MTAGFSNEEIIACATRTSADEIRASCSQVPLALEELAPGEIRAHRPGRRQRRADHRPEELMQRSFVGVERTGALSQSKP